MGPLPKSILSYFWIQIWQVPSFSKSLKQLILREEPNPSCTFSSFYFIFWGQDRSGGGGRQETKSFTSKWGCSSEIVIVKGMPSLQAQQANSAPRHMPGASIVINGSCVCVRADDRSCLCINSSAIVQASSCVCYKRGSLLQLVAVSPSIKKETGIRAQSWFRNPVPDCVGN